MHPSWRLLCSVSQVLTFTKVGFVKDVGFCYVNWAILTGIAFSLQLIIVTFEKGVDFQYWLVLDDCPRAVLKRYCTAN